jgi:hypothetical protein
LIIRGIQYGDWLFCVSPKPNGLDARSDLDKPLKKQYT